jgi:glycosyltransferase involved in cell wall biosynthesis
MSERQLVLTLIVKNEEHVIERCLKSALPFVDKFLIVDTGSTDKTQQIAAETAEQLGVSGLILERPWVNFGSNRSEALQLVRQHFGSGDGHMDNPIWAFMIDADDSFEGGSSKADLRSHLAATNAKAAIINIRKGSVHYKRTCIFNMRYNWIYEGPVHEYPKCIDDEGLAATSPIISLADKGYYVEARCEGARSKDPLKYAKDAELLLEEIAVNPTNSRAVFYCAQSLRDSGQALKAVEMYKKRAAMGDWIEEVYVSILNVVRMWGETDLIWKVACVRRLEVAAEAMKIMRQKGQFNQEIYAFASLLADIVKLPEDGLFVEKEYYDWIFYDEFGIYAYYTGHYREAYIAGLRAYFGCPEHHKSRIKMNIDFAISKI